MRSYTLRALLGAVLAVGLMACQAAAASESAATRPASVSVAQRDAEVRLGNALVNNDVLAYTKAVNAAAEWADIKLLADNYVPPPPPKPWVELPKANPTVRSGPVAPAQNVGGKCGGAGANDQFIGRESGGNPNAVNPSSGAFGCWQLLPSTAAHCGIGPGSSIAQQAACAGSLSSSNWTCCEGSPPAKP